MGEDDQEEKFLRIAMPEVAAEFRKLQLDNQLGQYTRIELGRLTSGQNIMATAKAYQITYDRPKMEDKETQTAVWGLPLRDPLEEYFAETNSDCSETQEALEPDKESSTSQK